MPGERGELIHAIVADFVIKGIDPKEEDAAHELRLIAQEHFERAALPGEIAAVWWPRILRMTAGFPRLGTRPATTASPSAWPSGPGGANSPPSA